MESFEFVNPTRIIFGRGAESRVGEQVQGCRKVLLHYGGGSIKATGLYDRVVRSLQEAGVDWIRYDFNIDPLESWRQAEGAEEQGLCQIRYIHGLYALLDELMSRHPACSSNNARAADAGSISN